jgi:anti-anti-sigma factor
VYFDAAAISVDGTDVVQINGELDLAAAPVLDDLLRRAARRHVVVDATGLTFVDVVGVATLVRWHRELAADGGELVVRGATDGLLRILDLTGLAGSLPVEVG